MSINYYRIKMNESVAHIEHTLSDRGISTDGVVDCLRERGLNLRTPGSHLEKVYVLGDQLPMNVTLCPLYVQGYDSALIDPSCVGNPIEASRVGGKWTAMVETVLAVQKYLNKAQSGVIPSVNLTFADAGVLTKNPTSEDIDVLMRNEDAYRQAAGIFTEKGIPWSLSRYSNMPIEFPRFVPAMQPDEEIRPSAAKVHDLVAKLISDGIIFDESVINPETGSLRKNPKQIVSSMIKSYGQDATEWLIRQYWLFDGHESRKNRLNLYFERGELLLRLGNLFTHGVHYPRIDIIV